MYVLEWMVVVLFLKNLCTNNTRNSSFYYIQKNAKWTATSKKSGEKKILLHPDIGNVQGLEDNDFAVSDLILPEV